MAHSQGYTTSNDLVAALPDRIRLIPRGRGFANGRSARQLLETTLTQQSARLAGGLHKVVGRIAGLNGGRWIAAP